jgi:hypothetical protein
MEGLVVGSERKPRNRPRIYPSVTTGRDLAR